jgi:FlaA1/EpsC-like NDP-sugar epimerase
MDRLYSSISRTKKKLLFVTLDLMALPLALWSAFALRYSEFWPAAKIAPFWWLFLVIPFVGVYLFARLGLYRAVVRFMGQQAIVAILKGVIILSILLYAAAFLSHAESFPRSVPIIFALISTLYVAGTRFLVRGYYHKYVSGVAGKEPVLVYGAGDSGRQLALTLLNAREFRPVAFVDDDASLHGHSMHGIRVHAPSEIALLILKHDISRVVLALPSASRTQRKAILERIKHYPVHVQTLPSVTDLVSGKASYDQLQEVDLDDLLGREVVPPNEVLLHRSISDKVVMVTGAGGSIGSELCRQIIKLGPRLLVMYENSEFALYSIEKDLIKRLSTDFEHNYEMAAILGSVLDEKRLDSVITQYGVQTIFHAAAYKHVPMVEHNVLEGVRNNIFGTKVVAEAALRHAVERFILISTDKAVRPTNVMGATKRSAEQVVQVLAEKSRSTVFSMVRFGNVLGSSGSVVPLFRKQIEAGGPVTVTHQDITRYFMSIPEASQLVIQAGAMAQGGDVFVLDMGKPVKIYDLARNMIELSGLEVLDESNPDGDIAIEVTGLRPGEKLYEELLIGDNVSGTEHPLIMRANEEYLAEHELDEALAAMERHIADNDPTSARKLLKKIVIDYKPSSSLVDHLQGKASERNETSPGLYVGCTESAEGFITH